MAENVGAKPTLHAHGDQERDVTSNVRGSVLFTPHDGASPEKKHWMRTVPVES